METRDKSGPGWSLIETLRSSELSEIIEDIGELGLDQALQDGILRDVPIVKWVLGIGKTAVAVRDYFLIRKIFRFFRSLSEVEPEERLKILGKIESDEEYQRRVGEIIVMLLDRYDHLDKAYLMAKVFCAYGREQISLDEFLRISTSIDRAFIIDLNDLLDYFAADEIDISVKRTTRRAKRNLYTSDFSDFYVLTDEEFKRSGLQYPQVYHFSSLGRKFAEIILEDKYHDDRW
jgi:hypothetical protein